MPDLPTVIEEPLYLTQGADHESHVYVETRSVAVANIVVGNPCTIQTVGTHGLVNGQFINIRNHTLPNDAPSPLNATHVITVTSTTAFTIPVSATQVGSGASVYVPADLSGFNFYGQIRTRSLSQSDIPTAPATTIKDQREVYFEVDPGLEPGDRLYIPTSGVNSMVLQTFVPLDSEFVSGATVAIAATETKNAQKAYRRGQVVADFAFSTFPQAGKIIRRLEDAIISEIPISINAEYDLYRHDLFYDQAGVKGRISAGNVYVFPRYTLS